MKLTTDADWASDVRTRKSQEGVHFVQHWCRRQTVIPLSSGEAE